MLTAHWLSTTPQGERRMHSLFRGTASSGRWLWARFAPCAGWVFCLLTLSSKGAPASFRLPPRQVLCVEQVAPVVLGVGERLLPSHRASRVYLHHRGLWIAGASAGVHHWHAVTTARLQHLRESTAHGACTHARTHLLLQGCPAQLMRRCASTQWIRAQPHS